MIHEKSQLHSQIAAMEQDQQNMSANVQVHAEVQAQANDGRLNGNAEEKTTSTALGHSVDSGRDNVNKNDKNIANG